MEEQLNELFKLLETILEENPDEFITNAGPSIMTSISNSLLGKDAYYGISQFLSDVDLQGMTVSEYVQGMEAIKNLFYEKTVELKNKYTDSKVKQEFCDMFYSIIETYFVSLNNYYTTRVEATVGVELMNEAAKLPVYAHESDQGADVSSAEDITIQPHTYGNVVHTGLKLLIPQTWAVSIRPRSGLSKKTTLRISNSPATIDQQYRGEVMILFDNIGDESVEIKAGERIAQLIFEKNYHANYTQVDSVEPTTERGEGGFGSTGTN